MSNKPFEQEITLEDGTTTTIYVKAPSNDAIKEADIHRAKIWNKAFKEGVLTKAEVKEVMRNRGIWDDEKEDKEQTLSKEILELEKQLFRGGGKKKPKLSDGRKLAVEMRQKRFELRDLIAERLSMDENTAESISDNAKFDFLVAYCSFYSDTDKEIFEDYEDYSARGSSFLAQNAAALLARMMYDLDADYEDKLPENIFLKKYGLVDDNGYLIDPVNKNMVDPDGRRINELGQYIDDKGERVDIEGTPLDSNGLYELVDYENDLGNKPKTTRRKTTKKTVEK